ncbi:hypothetical protein CLOBOL_06052 [Enterocloster bolteae ATCC BAA-613]|uniref:Uncharacterized protein n=1 Tax=Enterocloster bolteae (strain ATCC BAA-613 / DSM 15670 / CCUG 46953 / JCM 12243 / WAL 16351) TaxID=411902 RepID=A8S2E5_ENTBW|nr:hypothetical protein CLOBOL_06052 [Enterocloster bolteae ATCC BAA-613]
MHRSRGVWACCYDKKIREYFKKRGRKRAASLFGR